MKDENTIFDRNASQALKGIAIILMLFHHCFRIPQYYAGFVIDFSPFSEYQTNNIAECFKICVSVFAFITGYGLFLTFQKKSAEESASNWCIKRYIKTMSGYWFIWLLVVPVTWLTGGTLKEIIDQIGLYQGCAQTVVSFLGFQRLFQTNPILLNSWYISAAIVFIMVMPIVWRCRNNLWMLLFWVVAIPRILTGENGNAFAGGSQILSFLLPYLIGSIFARYSVFNKWLCIGKNAPKIKAYKLVAELWLLIFCCIGYNKLPVEIFWEFHFGIFPMIFITFALEFVLTVRSVARIFHFLGIHSLNMWLLHGYLIRFAYSGRHFIIVTLILIGLSLTASIALEKIKKLMRYNLFINKLIEHLT